MDRALTGGWPHALQGRSKQRSHASGSRQPTTKGAHLHADLDASGASWLLFVALEEKVRRTLEASTGARETGRREPRPRTHLGLPLSTRQTLGHSPSHRTSSAASERVGHVAAVRPRPREVDSPQSDCASDLAPSCEPLDAESRSACRGRSRKAVRRCMSPSRRRPRGVLRAFAFRRGR